MLTLIVMGTCDYGDDDDDVTTVAVLEAMTAVDAVVAHHDWFMAESVE